MLVPVSTDDFRASLWSAEHSDLVVPPTRLQGVRSLTPVQVHGQSNAKTTTQCRYIQSHLESRDLPVPNFL